METTLIPKIISFPVALGISFLFTLSIIDLAKKLQLFDGNNHLKQHLEKVSSLGGIAVFSAFWIAISLVSGLQGVVVTNYLFVGSFILFLTGIRDDLIGIPPLKRLFIQVSVASLMFIGGIRLTYLPGFETELPFWGSYVLTIFLIGAIVNAYNFIDGINGLAGGMGVLSSVSFSIIFYFSGLEQYAAMALSLAGGITGFLWFNFGTAKIFMGDNGSTFIGIMFSFFAISFFQHHNLNGGVVNWQPALVFAILMVPVADLSKVVIGRLLRGVSPFKGDRSHIHHLLMKTGLTQRYTCYVLYGWNILVILFSVLFLSQNMLTGSFTLVLVSSLPYLVMNWLPESEKETEQFPIRVKKPSKIY